MKEKIISKNDIIFELERKKVKNINIRVTKNLEVKVSAPSKTDREYIISLVDKNAEVIKNKLELLERRKLEIEDYKMENKDKVKYLGKVYKIKESTEINLPKIDEDYLMINKDKDRSKEIDKFYKLESERIFRESLDRMYTLIEDYRVEYPKMDIRYMKSIWGSCHINKGKIVLNMHLIKCEIELIDYVVLHELVHFKHRYHDNKFYKELEKRMPDYKNRVRKLNEDYTIDLY